MRWSIIRLIWLRELRDQLRDRRTLMMIAGLPLLLYPVLGFAVTQLARGFVEQPSPVGIVVGPGAMRDFPPRHPDTAGLSPLPNLSLFAATPVAGVTAPLAALTLERAGHAILDYRPFVRGGRILPEVRIPAGHVDDRQFVRLVFLDDLDLDRLDRGEVDLILSVPDDFYTSLEHGEGTGAGPRPALRLHARPNDDRSRLAARRLTPLLDVWKHGLRRARLARRGLPPHFSEPYELRDPTSVASLDVQGRVTDMMIRVFPFMLVMWSLAGALYPAVDICAGEKERGTMETLLITPAGREEIVLGKFLTIWVFSAGTALLNLLSMGITTLMIGELLPHGGLSPAALFWCVLLCLPQAALFSAVSLAIGAYARSSKEGQYYLMPLFLVTMPLLFLTLAPGVELNPLYALVPVTGVALLMQRLMTASGLEQVPWLYFAPVLVPIAVYSWLALRWAIVQFQREEVLFREAERLDVRLWLRRLFREKEALPTTGQAFFCFGLILLLRWLSLGMDGGWPLEVHTAVSLLAFVAAPPLFMALMLNTRPLAALALLRPPNLREVGIAAALAVLLLPPLAALTQAAAAWLPDLLRDPHPIVGILRALSEGDELSTSQLGRYLLAYALLPAICEELAFRGFILTGLQSRLRPRNAVLLSAFLFALYHMNVFLSVPMFCLGVALGLLTRRSGSVLPAVSLHFLHNAALILAIPLGRSVEAWLPGVAEGLWPGLVGVCVTLSAGLLWWLYRKPYADLERAERQARTRDESPTVAS